MLIINQCCLDFDASCYLYWIHCKGHTDISKQGYVGITTNVKKRLISHNRSLFNYNGKNKQGYSESFIEAFKNRDLICSVVDCGSIQSMLTKEMKLRPVANIGWNVAQGGKTPSQLKHQSSGDRRVLLLKKLVRSLNNDGVYIDINFTTDDAVRLLKMHEDSEPTSSRCSLRLKDRSKGLVVGNFYYHDVSYTKTKTFKYCGKVWTFAEACEHNGVSLNTACKRYKSYGMSIESSVGFGKHIPNSIDIVYLNGIPCNYNNKITSYSKESLVEMYICYSNGGRNFKSLCESFGVSHGNMLRYFKRYGLNSSVDRRTKLHRRGNVE